MKKRAPYFPMYPTDFMEGCRKAGMTPEQVGFYTFLLNLEWQDQAPVDAENLSTRTGWDPRLVKRLIRELVALGKYQQTADGKLLNPRMQEEIEAFKNGQLAKVTKRQLRDSSSTATPQLFDSYPIATQQLSKNFPENQANSTVPPQKSSRTRARAESDSESKTERESEGRESLRPRDPPADGSLFEPDECGTRLVENGSAFKWVDPKTGEPRKLSYQWCESELPGEKPDVVRAFFKSELIVALDQGKDGSLHGLMRHAVAKRFPTWRQRRESARRSRREADELREPAYQGTLEPGAWEY